MRIVCCYVTAVISATIVNAYLYRWYRYPEECGSVQTVHRRAGTIVDKWQVQLKDILGFFGINVLLLFEMWSSIELKSHMT